MIAFNLICGTILLCFAFYWYREAYREWCKVPRFWKLIVCTMGLGSITVFFAIIALAVAAADVFGLI